MTEPSEGQGTTQKSERRIVVGIDGSPGAARALEYAAHQAARTGALLHVVCVYHLLPAEDTLIAPMALVEASAATVVAQGVDLVSEIEPGVVAKGEDHLGAPGPVLVEISERASELVVGTRGRGHLRGMLLGSVSEYVAHHASCTTTVVR